MQYLCKKEEFEEELSKILPELVYFCEYVKEYVYFLYLSNINCCGILLSIKEFYVNYISNGIDLLEKYWLVIVEMLLSIKKKLIT